ncbi:TetR/AcrR family transcriptional regulator [Streptomyces cavernicola]|uniref:TetR family transcriptional regulator n=1 Tax=Streptomyces cavernicola TaxID=3043613 RepID=A0ABT6SDK5_9ACTN|nr:TetR family transcriptional regulator [Streptomyces sp. B-S-A6]MDI3406258.1 TetR family transcriptional regulator [Streptomyces sp. B-S-A6]
MTRFRQAVRTLLREQILDAAYRLVTEEGWARLRVAPVARGAGCSRQTVYNEFGTNPKSAIGLALVEREAERFLLGIQEQLDAHRDSLEAAAAAGVGFVLHRADANPLIRSVLTAARGGQDDELLAYLTTRPEPVFDTATAMLDAYAADTWPEVDAASRSLAVETIVRLTVSHIVQPAADPEQSAGRIAAITARIAYPAKE